MTAQDVVFLFDVDNTWSTTMQPWTRFVRKFSDDAINTSHICWRTIARSTQSERNPSNSNHRSTDALSIALVLVQSPQRLQAPVLLPSSRR
jgi:hypothetical protein